MTKPGFVATIVSMAASEELSVFAAMVSAGAAALGAYVSYRQWRDSRPQVPKPSRRAEEPSRAGSGTPPATGTPSAPVAGREVPRVSPHFPVSASPEAPAGKRDALTRLSTLSAALGGLACGLIPLGMFLNLVVGVQGGLVNATIVGYVVSALGAIALGLIVVVPALLRRRLRNARTAFLGIVLALLPLLFGQSWNP